MTFGEASILNDGRVVVAHWMQPQLQIGDQVLASPVLRYPDAALTAGGVIWVIGKDQNGYGGWLLRVGRPWKKFADYVQGSRAIIRADGEGCRIAYTSSETHWIELAVTPDGVISVASTGTVLDGGGTNGMRDWFGGTPRPMTGNLDTRLNGHLVRAAITSLDGLTTIGCALDLPDQVVVQRQGQLGTLHRPGSDWQSLRLSGSGRCWAGARYEGELVLFGTVPLTAPPLVTSVPPPEVVVPKATIVSYDASVELGTLALAVAKLTQGDPTKAWYQWQYEYQGSWTNANIRANNRATDNDHHYLLPSVGMFPIRLQTWDDPVSTNPKHMTDQTGTARTITVRPRVAVPLPTPVPPSPPAPASFRGQLSAKGTAFVNEAGEIVHIHGVTGFTAFEKWLRGERQDLRDYAAYIRSLNAFAIRVFGMWTVTGFTPKGRANYYSELRPFAAFWRDQGIHLLHTLFCDQDPKSKSTIVLSAGEQQDHYHRTSDAFAGTDNVVAELVNEDWQNGQIAHLFGLVNGCRTTRSAFQDGKSYLQPGPLLQFTNEHTPRTWDFSRKAKNLLETARTGFKNPDGSVLAPPSGVPAVCWEPIGIFEQAQPGRRTNDPRAISDYFAVADLCGAGAVLHGDMTSLMTCQRPGPIGQRCAEAAAKAWQAGIPANAASDGLYTRGGLGDCPLVHSDRFDDDGHEIDPRGALRTFVMRQGDRATAVVVQPGANYGLPRAQNGWRVVGTSGPYPNQVVFLAR